MKVLTVDILRPQGIHEEVVWQEFLESSAYTVVYFYPKDNTPGCTIQAHEYSTLIEDFKKLGCQVVGVSKDSIVSHKKFIDTCGLSIPLITDSDQKLHMLFGVWGEKKMYGKIYHGAIRSSFVLDKSGNILHESKNIQAKGDAQDTLQRLSNYIQGK